MVFFTSGAVWPVATLVLIILGIVLFVVGANEVLHEEIFCAFAFICELLAIAGIVLSFIYWSWIIMLMIVGGLIILAVIIWLIGFLYNKKEAKDAEAWASQYYNEKAYPEYTVNELKIICLRRAIDITGINKKTSLINILEAYDEKNDIKPRERTDDESNSVKTDRESDGKRDIKPIPKGKKTNVPAVKLSDIAGLEEAKKALEERVILPMKYKEVFEKYGKKTGGGILLYGLPGTGKTMFAQAVATEIDARFFDIKCSDIQTKWIGESEIKIRSLFENARKYARSVIFFDEFDSLGAKRKELDSSNNNVVQEILTQMQGVQSNKRSLMVIAATNCPRQLDGALLRPGRFDEKIYIPLPDLKARYFILNKQLKGCPLGDGVNLDVMAEKLDGFSGADVAEFCEKLKMLLIRKNISGQNEEITKDEVYQLLKNSKSSILKSDISRMDEYRNRKTGQQIGFGN